MRKRHRYQEGGPFRIGDKEVPRPFDTSRIGEALASAIVGGDSVLQEQDRVARLVRGDEANGDVFSRPLETVPKPFNLTRLLLNRDTLGRPGAGTTEEGLKDILRFGRKALSPLGGIANLIAKSTVGPTRPHEVRGRLVQRQSGGKIPGYQEGGRIPEVREPLRLPEGISSLLIKGPSSRRPSDMFVEDDSGKFVPRSYKQPKDDPIRQLLDRKRKEKRKRALENLLSGEPNLDLGPEYGEELRRRLAEQTKIINRGPPRRASGGLIPGYQFGGQWGGGGGGMQQGFGPPAPGGGGWGSSKGADPSTHFGRGVPTGAAMQQQPPRPPAPQWGGGPQQQQQQPPSPGGWNNPSGASTFKNGQELAPGGGPPPSGMMQPLYNKMAQPGAGMSMPSPGFGGSPKVPGGPDTGPPGSPGGGGQPPAGQPPTGQPPAGQPPQPTPYQPQALPKHYGRPEAYQGYGLPADFASTQSFVSPEVAQDWAAIKSGIMQSGGRAYDPYAGPHLAGFNPDEAAAQAAYAAYGRGAGPASTTAAARTLRGAGRGLESLAPEQARMASTFGAYAPFAQEQAQATAEEMKATGQQAGTPEMQREADLSSYQSQFVQGAIDPKIEAVRREAEIQRAQLGSQAAQAGAFGSYRHGLGEQAAAQAATQQIADITGEGYQKAFESAQQAFQGDRAAQQAGLQQQQQAQQAAGALQQQGFGTAADLWRGQQGALGAEAGLYGQMTQTGAAQTELGRQEQAQQLERLRQMQLSGQQQRKLTQAGYDIQKGLHKEAQQWAPQQLEWMTRMMGALPYQNIQQQALYQTRPGDVQRGAAGLVDIWNTLGAGQGQPPATTETPPAGTDVTQEDYEFVDIHGNPITAEESANLASRPTGARATDHVPTQSPYRGAP